MNRDLGVIGAGNMAEAIIRGVIDKGLFDAERIIVADPAPQRREVFAALGVDAVDDNTRVIGESQAILLAVKPQTLDKLAGDLAEVDAGRQVVLSILAGAGTAKIAGMIGGEARVVRIMPNTPLLVGLGMSAIAPGEHATDADVSLAMEMFGVAGEAVVVAESQMDAVTAVSGSGPAYVYYLAEAMLRAAEDLGMTASQARRFVNQTVLGAATLLHDADETADVLRRKVASPGGTTEAALDHLDAHQVSRAVTDAVRRAAERSAELGG